MESANLYRTGNSHTHFERSLKSRVGWGIAPYRRDLSYPVREDSVEQTVEYSEQFSLADSNTNVEIIA